MKKFLMVLVVLAMVISLVACGGDSTSESNNNDETAKEETAKMDNETVSLTVQAEEGWKDYYQKALVRVKEKYPNADISLNVVSSFDHLDSLDATDVTNEDIADVFAYPADRLAGLSQKEALAFIDGPAIAQKVGGYQGNSYEEGFGGNLKVDDHYLGFPMNIETLILFVNKANANANGLDLNNKVEFTTLDNGQTMLLPVFNAWFAVALTNAADIELLEKTDGGFRSDLTADWADLPEQKRAVFTALYDYWKKHDELGTSLWDKDAAWGYMDTAFKTGNAAALRIEGPWSTPNLSKVVGDNANDLDILSIGSVTVNGMPLKHWQGGWALGINARIEDDPVKMDIAQDIIAEIVNPEYAVDFFKSTGKILENVDGAVYDSSDLSDVDKKVILATLESFKNAPARPLFSEWGAVWDTWQNAILSWTSLKPASAQEAYQQVQASFQSMMANN